MSSVVRVDSDGASTMDLSGRCVGSSYILQHPIGQGATGTVWRGLDRASGEPVAVKLLHESLLGQPKLVTRFVQERTILLMLRHRNVVRVRDLFSVGETLGLVMDLVDGGSMRDHLRQNGPLPAGEAARLACQVAAALAEAHELGVVHRDLKPDNILLRISDGRLDTRLTDFGVARILNTPSMTTPNAVVGTPHYMAPEAFHGTAASPATDVYALGVLLYELVSGRPPYDTDQIPDLMRRHMEGSPERPQGMPEPIWEVIDQCMAVKPRLRPSAAELVVSLSDAARDCRGTEALPRPRAAVTEPGMPGEDSRAIRPPVCGHDGGAVPSAVRSLSEAGVGDRQVEQDPVSVVPLPRLPEAGPAGHGGVERRRPKDRGNAAPGWRWARPGATLIAIAMVSSAVAATAWQFGRADGRVVQEGELPQVFTAPSAAKLPYQASTGVRGPRKNVAETDPVRTHPRVAGGSAAARSATAVPVPAKSATAPRPPQPEAKPYGPWQCTDRLAVDFGSKTPVVTRPCEMTGRDIQFRASLSAPGGGTGRITVSLQETGTGKTVAGPKNCDGLAFGGDAATRSCGPLGVKPARGKKYAVVMSFRYQRNGRTMAGSAKGSAFDW